MAIVQKFLINAHVNARFSREFANANILSSHYEHSRGNVEILVASVPANEFGFDVTLVTLTCNLPQLKGAKKN